ncbi:MAG: response regulator transcription factor [Deltaproteobacteria bacterium]|nr:response regulator transcription factor [Deltaproteobacteria bacterium]
MTTKILVVDSDESIVDKISALFNGAGYTCTGAHSGAECVRRIQNTRFDLIIMELELPDMPGTELCRTLKYNGATASTPLMFLSRMGAEMDRVVGLSLGATDYVVKPFSSRELVLRVRAILRRTAQRKTQSVLTNGVITLDPRSHQATLDSETLTLTRIEFRLLASLVGAGGHVLKREQIIELVWGENAHVLDRTVDAHIRTLRKKMGVAKDELETVQGVGYRIRQHRDVHCENTASKNSDVGYTTVNDMF